ncbi:MAG: chorismate synthase [Eubacteriales bacterium]|jgi:chorismate synthase
MPGSSFGTLFRVTTWGESHGKAIGAVVDGCPAGLPLTEDDIQPYLDRRKPGQSRYTTKRNESDTVHIMSGTFEGKTTGTPISLLIMNNDQHSRDYSNIMDKYRPGHADFGFDQKFGFRDYRGGGRSSGRETAARTAAGAVASLLLKELGIQVSAYTTAIGPVHIRSFDRAEIMNNPLYMPDAGAAAEASHYLETCMSEKNSAGGIIECRASGVMPGLGDPVFDKLDAELAKAVMSIGAVKGVEIGDGFSAASSTGKDDNDGFEPDGNGGIRPSTNHAGGILGGISDGADIVVRCAVKPTASIAQPQKTVNSAGEPVSIEIKGRHDPVIVPRAVVVVESMVSIVLADAVLRGTTAKLENIKTIWNR